MIPKPIRELIRASRRTAREFGAALEEVGQLLRERQSHHQPNPVRVPVRARNTSTGHPLHGARSPHSGSNRFNSSYSRHFSTGRVASANSIKSSFINANIFQRYPTAASFKPKYSISNTFKAALYQTQPFRTATRAQVRVGFGLYTNFPRHNARMFSTFGPNVTRQAVENLSQNIRMMFLKGGELGSNYAHSNVAQSTPVAYLTNDESFADRDIRLASRVSETSGAFESGSIVEFDMTAPTIAPNFPISGFFDDEFEQDLTAFHISTVEHQKRVVKDVKLFKENIGSTSFKFNKAKMRLRFYCPNCDVVKMERLLAESGISTGLVYRNTEPDSFSDTDSGSDSEFSGPDMVSDSSTSSSCSILSTSASSSPSTSSLRSDYFLVEPLSSSGTGTDSVLSSSSEYFEADTSFPITATAIRV
jgi:hypothetical protein